MKKARLAAAEKGSYFPKTPDEPFTVANLQRIKRSIKETMDTKAKSQKGLGPTEAAEITNTLDTFTGWLRSKSKGFAEAEDIYAKNIKPIKQMEAGQKMSEALKGRLSETERPTKYNTVVDALTKKGEMKNLTDKQLSSKLEVDRQLYRDKTLSEQATKGAKAMNERMGTMFDFQKVGILERSIVIMNAILKRIEGKNSAKALDILSDSMMNPQKMAKLLKEASPKEAAALKKDMNMGRQLTTGSAISAAQQAGEQ